jgi:signal transduction histidine kinase
MELAIMLELYADEFSAQLKRRERLAAIGQVGASISHEVKNPLGVIASSLFALREHRSGKADEVERRHFERLQRNVDQANQIVCSLLDFLRDRVPVRVERDWAELVSAAVDEAALPEGVRIERVLEPSSGRAAVDAVQVTRVVSNLVRNAAEASGEGGVVTVTARGDSAGVEVVVQDRGSGLPPVAMPQLFEPLFTTKQVGTGLGLALAKAIAEAHGGTITASNREGGGAEFLVRLPRAPAPPPGFDAEKARPSAERASAERSGP